MDIGFIGLGIMGASMCENVVKKHDGKVYVSDIDKSKVKALENIGALGCENNSQAAKNSDVIITMTPRSEHSKAVYSEILPFLGRGKLCIDMGTIDPDVSVEISKSVKKTGAGFVDAPVVKSKSAAISATLGIYVGGDEEDFQKAKPILSYMGTNIIRMGENGKGLVMKICHNALVAQIQNGVNETLALARMEGISVDDFATAISYGGGQNFYLDGQAQNIKNENWETAFSLENMQKDLSICERLSASLDFPMPGMKNAKAVYDEGLRQGIGKEDFRATYKIVRRRRP